MSGAGVEVDTRKLEAGSKGMVAGIKRKVSPAANKTGSQVADRVRALVPVKTGTLRDTVHSEPIDDGAQVHYGGETQYATYIANRTGCVDQGLSGAEQLFQRMMREVAASEVRKV